MGIVINVEHIPLLKSQCVMPKTIEAVVDDEGRIQLLESVSLRARQRVLVTLLDEELPTASSTKESSATEKTGAEVGDTARLSEDALARDWNRDEEEEAWEHLQPDR